MKLYFLKVGSKFISRDSKFNAQSADMMSLHYTHNPDDARYYDSERSAKGVNTFLNKRGLKTYIVIANVIIQDFTEKMY